MVNWPWRDGDEESENPHIDALVVCAFQDGTIAVYPDRVVIDRPGRSRFDDATFPLESVIGVDYDEGITVGYLQVEIDGVTSDPSGLLSDPVNERTVHFGRGNRECAREARDTIRERAGG
jgi:hypothetical protein